jgi:hypothetical protein
MTALSRRQMPCVVAATRVRAAERYVEQARAGLKLLEERWAQGMDVSRVPVLQAAYLRADAEYLLAKQQAAR